MTLQNVHVQRGPAGVVICATWRHAPPSCDVAAAREDAGTSPPLPVHAWLQQKLKEWKSAA
jgi:hypothetical protein